MARPVHFDRVVTYRLAYRPLDVNLCSECLERDDHDLGTVSVVQHGLHDGICDSPTHGHVGYTTTSMGEVL